MSMEIRILHCGDILLDSPIPSPLPEQSEAGRREVREALRKIGDYVVKEQIHLVILSGNLFDRRYATFRTAETLAGLIASAPGTRFVITPGHYDYFDADSIYAGEFLPSNTVIFRASMPARVAFPEWELAVYGWAYNSPEHRVILPMLAEGDDLLTTVLCGCCEGDNVLPDSEFASFGTDLVLLSGSDKPYAGFHTAGQTQIAYSGAVACMHYEDNAIGGANLIRVVRGGMKPEIYTERLTFGEVFRADEKVDITGLSTLQEVTGRIREMIAARGFGKNTALRVTLTGTVSPQLAVPRNLMGETFGLVAFELRDESVPVIDPMMLRDMSARGELYRMLAPRIAGQDARDRAEAARTLRIGLAALEGRDITHL